eukprot:TRINITY_DN5892_c0_g1_i1.p1 TRINITY_DN5892_c0_g1~~TRINITY_DN5892_c0_g1_i1.p1  ORF type:complete len:111 (-),score=2.04 TRINITY_DN5892_c0_g1_i1:34-366(-)
MSKTIIFLLVLLTSSIVVIESVPCLQSEWNQTTHACFILNNCDFGMYGFALCDKDVSICGSEKPEGVIMCPHSRFYIGLCYDECQGLTWNSSNSTQCSTDGKCCPPREPC